MCSAVQAQLQQALHTDAHTCNSPPPPNKAHPLCALLARRLQATNNNSPLTMQAKRNNSSRRLQATNNNSPLTMQAKRARWRAHTHQLVTAAPHAHLPVRAACHHAAAHQGAAQRGAARTRRVRRRRQRAAVQPWRSWGLGAAEVLCTVGRKGGVGARGRACACGARQPRRLCGRQGRSGQHRQARPVGH